MSAKPTKNSLSTTVFQEDSRFKGSLKFTNPLLILGEFEGEISGGSYLEIGPTAKVQSRLEAEHIVIYGQVEGNVIASDKVELREGARLTGNIRAPRMEMEEGVLFDGQCEMRAPVAS